MEEDASQHGENKEFVKITVLLSSTWSYICDVEGPWDEVAEQNYAPAQQVEEEPGQDSHNLKSH